jgi:hypothetical protein
MSRLVEVRDETIAAFKASPLLAGVFVTSHGGEFGEADLLRYSKQTPALIVAMLRYDMRIEGGLVTGDAIWGVIAMAKSDPGVKRDVGVLALTDAAIRVLGRTFMGTDGVSRPKELVAKNEYGPKIDAQGIAMWSITYRQTVDLADDVDAAVDLERIHTDYVKPGDVAGFVEAPP